MDEPYGRPGDQFDVMPRGWVAGAVFATGPAGGVTLEPGFAETMIGRLKSAIRAITTGDGERPEIAGYELGRVIGKGGMSKVYEARRQRDGLLVAIKVMARASERFEREVEALAQLRSPHIVGVHDAGRTEDGAYIVMERLQGTDLATLLRQGRLTLNEALRLIDQVALGLEEAHGVGMVHRDIKPSNLFCAAQGEKRRWKVLDFGLAKIFGVDKSITRGFIVGTPGYMSPEQALGESLDCRSDIFALAAVAYTTITGAQPFRARDPVAITYRVIHTMPPQPSELTKVHADVDAILALGLAKHVANRIVSAASFAKALRDACYGQLDDELRQSAAALLHVYPWQPADEAPTLTARTTDTVPMRADAIGTAC